MRNLAAQAQMLGAETISALEPSCFKHLMTWFGAACELHRDWRNDVEGLGALFSNHLPNYRCLINSYLHTKG